MLNPLSPFSWGSLLATDAHLGAEAECNPTAFELGGGWVVELIGILYLAMVLGQLCDNFLMPALEELSRRADLSDDIAGVSILAFGGSAPELAIHMIATLQKREVGSGAIVGSAIYNITIGLAVVALLVPTAQLLPVPPVVRDISGYLIILFLLEIVRRDGVIQLWEGALLIGFYLLFLVTLIPFSKTLGKAFRPSVAYLEAEEAADIERESLLEKNKNAGSVRVITRQGSVLSEEGNWFVRGIAKLSVALTKPFDSFFFKYTIPNSEEKPDRYIAGLFLSLLWIFAFSFGMMTLVERIACALGLDEGVGGLIILAIGASLPDTIAMGIAAKRGHGAMAIAGLIGSNIFDIGIGLGFPWLVYNIMHGEGVKQENKKVGASIIYLFVAAVAFVISISLHKFRIKPSVAILPLLVYGVYVATEIASAEK